MEDVSNFSCPGMEHVFNFSCPGMEDVSNFSCPGMEDVSHFSWPGMEVALNVSGPGMGLVMVWKKLTGLSVTSLSWHIRLLFFALPERERSACEALRMQGF